MQGTVYVPQPGIYGVPLRHGHWLLSFSATTTTEISTLSLHDALPIWARRPSTLCRPRARRRWRRCADSSCRARSEEHTSELQYPSISYAVFCLKKKSMSIRTVSMVFQSAKSVRFYQGGRLCCQTCQYT